MPNRQRKRERGVVSIIQKVCRGYIARKKVLVDRNHQKMELAFEFFDKIKFKMEEDAVYRIVYQFRKYCKVKRRERMEAEARKLASKSGKTKFGAKAKKVVNAQKAVNVMAKTMPKPAAKEATATTPLMDKHVSERSEIGVEDGTPVE